MKFKSKISILWSDVSQLVITIVVFVTTVLFPIVNYYIFKESLVQGIEVGDLEQRYDIIIVMVVCIGVLTTVVTYLIYYFPRYSLKRGYLAFLQSILDILFLIIFSQMSSVSVFFEGSGVIIDFGGVYTLLLIAISLFVFKNIFDIIDFRRNKDFYNRKLRAKEALASKESNRKIKCGNCGYVCRKGWKKCPICSTRLK